VKQNQRRFQAEVFPALLFIVLAPMLAIKFGGRYQAVIMLGNLALFAATLRWRCLNCGETGNLLFPKRHECDPLRSRSAGSMPPPESASPGSFASMIVILMVLAVVIMCAYLMATG
jgi:hypothetical protein